MSIKEVQGVIHLDTRASPAVLAGLLDINVRMIYQARQEGKLPAEESATYRQCIRHYLNYWKNKSSRRSSNIMEASILQKMKLDSAKTEMQWLEVKAKRQELVDKVELVKLLEPAFTHLRMTLTTLTRKFPETIEMIDKALLEFSKAGDILQDSSKKEMENFIQMKQDEGADYEEVSEINGVETDSTQRLEEFSEDLYFNELQTERKIFLEDVKDII